MPERPTNCPTCSKRLSRKQWYYRNGQFYCKKRCWETAREKTKEETAAKAKEGKGKEAQAQPAEAKAQQAEAKPGG